MKSRTAVILVVLGVFALAGGWWFGTRTEPGEQTTVAPGNADVPRARRKAPAGRTRRDHPPGKRW